MFKVWPCVLRHVRHAHLHRVVDQNHDPDYSLGHQLDKLASSALCGLTHHRKCRKEAPGLSCFVEARELFISAAAPPPTIQITYKQWFLFSFVFRAQLYILKTVLAPPVALESQQRGVVYSQCLPETGAGGVGFCLSLSSAFLPSGTPGGREANLRRRESLGRFCVGSHHHSCPSTHEQLTETLGSGTQAGQPGLLERPSSCRTKSTLLWPPSMGPSYDSLSKWHHKGRVHSEHGL